MFNKKKAIAMMLCAAIGVSAIPVSAMSEQEQLDQTNSEIEQLKIEQSQMQTDLDTYQSDLETISEEIADLEEQISNKSTDISDLEAQISELEEARDLQQQQVSDRMKYVYENDQTSLLDVLFAAESFADFLNRTEYLAQMDQYDRSIIDAYNTTCEELAELQTTLSTESATLAELQAQSEEKQSQLEGQIDTTSANLVMSAEELAEKEAEAKSLEASINAANASAMMAKAEEMLNYTETTLVEVEVPVEVTEEIEVEVEVPVEESAGSEDAASSAETAVEQAEAAETQGANDTSNASAETDSAATSQTAQTTKTTTKTVKQTVTKTVYKTIYEEASTTGAYNYPDYSGQVYNASSAERKMLAAIIYCEAGGEPYAGQLAVGSVIMNRVYSSNFPNSLSGVIYQSGQFAPVASGRLAMIIANESYTQTCLNAADAVLSGNLNVKYWFFFSASYWSGNYAQKIANQVFF